MHSKLWYSRVVSAIWGVPLRERPKVKLKHLAIQILGVLYVKKCRKNVDIKDCPGIAFPYCN